MTSENKSIMQHNLNGGIQFINETDSIIHGKGDYGGLKRSRDDAGIDNTDSDNEGGSQGLGFGPNDSGFSNSKSGKKTRGRVKIDMKYIDNKLRRYTTFSKRKTGIMKKAYELSTLTGTQVMLLVASETGHVYTFATRKLQPMITSDTGKALIQTCLNSPDLGQSSPGGQVQPSDQRMNPSGYEETEITYSQEDELSHRVTPPEVNIKQESAYGSKAISSSPAYIIPQSQRVVNGDNPNVHMISPDASTAQTSPDTLTTPQYHIQTAHQPQTTHSTANKNSTVTMQIPAASYVLPQSGSNVGNQGTDTVTAPLLVSSPSALPSQQGIALLQGGMNSLNTSQATLVYQALQGMVCASPQQIGNLPEGGFVLGVPQSSALALPQSDGNTGGGTPQYITIPVPVSMAANTGHPQMFAIPVPQPGGTASNMKKS